VKDIPPAARRNFSAEDKIRIVLDGLRGEDSIAELRRKEIVALADAVTNLSKTKAAPRVGAKHRYWPTSGSLPAQTSTCKNGSLSPFRF
jgi:transposase-like protein